MLDSRDRPDGAQPLASVLFDALEALIGLEVLANLFDLSRINQLAPRNPIASRVRLTVESATELARSRPCWRTISS